MTMNSDEARRTIESLNAVGSPVERQVRRLRRKMEKRDEKIAGLKRRIADLEHALAVKDVEVKRLPRDVEFSGVPLGAPGARRPVARPVE